MKKDQEQDELENKNLGIGKNPYRSPRLVEYGDFRKVTLVKGNVGGDAPQHPKTKAVGGG
jgi:hypothetical protein